MRELEESKTRLGRSAALAGMSQSSPVLGIEADYEEGTLNKLMQELGRLYEGERTRKLGLVPYALEEPLSKIQAAQSVEESPLRMAMSLLSGYEPTYYQPSYRYEPSMFEQIMQYGAIPYILGTL